MGCCYSIIRWIFKYDDSILGLEEICNCRLLISQASAEFIGTFLIMSPLWLILHPTHNFFLHTAYALGLMVGAVVQAVGDVSGAHINPAVTLGSFIGGEIRLTKTILYIIFQLIGAVCGTYYILWEIPNTFNMWYEKCQLDPVPMHYFWSLESEERPRTVRIWNLERFKLYRIIPWPYIASEQAVVAIEGLMSFTWVLVSLSVQELRRKGGGASMSGSVVGFTVTVCHLASQPLTGGALNPARVYGPMFFFDDFTNAWMYWYGSFMGAIAAGVIWRVALRS